MAVRVLVTQSGPLTDQQQLWASVLAAGQGAGLAALTAARLDGLAGVQQRLVTPAQLNQVLQRCQRVPRRAPMRATLADVAGGAEALSELDFCDLLRRFGLPEPDRQFCRVEGQGRRWLDAIWEWAHLVAEIDGRWHMDARAWWADMARDNELTIDGYRVLRFPAFAVRDNPETVAGQIAAALRQTGEARGRLPAGSSDRFTVKPGR